MVTQSKGDKPVSDMRIYVTDEQRQQMDDLLKRLDGAGLPLKDNRGHYSYSKLIRVALNTLGDNITSTVKRETNSGKGSEQ